MQYIIKIMCYPAGQGTYRLRFLRLNQQCFQLFISGLRLLAFPDIPGSALDTGNIIVLVKCEFGEDFNRGPIANNKLPEER